MISSFKDLLIYSHINRFLKNLEKVFLGESESNPLVCNLNPILSGLLVLNLLEEIAEKYPVTKFRIEHLGDIINH